MSPSSGSWSGGRGADIIDLDRYMRGSVRPSRTLSDDSKQWYGSSELVVDGGGVSRGKSCSSASGDARFKRYSHDSGVSDGSYARRLTRRQHRPHRFPYNQERLARMPRDPSSTKTINARASSSSLRAFRTVCEQALLDQQRQIARVAELCERLTERADKTEVEKNEPVERPSRTSPDRSDQIDRSNEKMKRVLSEETSEISSSSRSTKDPRRKDTHRTQECKTYKIIMNKLDELNRLFATRPRAEAPRVPSSSSVSVCDKLIATDPQRTFDRVVTPTVKTHNARAAAGWGAGGGGRVAAARVTHAYAVDIAPRANVVTESIVKCDSSKNNSHRSMGDPRCGFDLEDPVHLYSQAKRLQAMTATTRRTRSVEGRATGGESHRGSHGGSHGGSRDPSLCAICRAYWRCLRQCIVGPLFGKTLGNYKCS